MTWYEWIVIGIAVGAAVVIIISLSMAPLHEDNDDHHNTRGGCA